MKFSIPIMVEMELGGDEDNIPTEVKETLESWGRDYLIAHCTWQHVAPVAREIGGLSFAPLKMTARPIRHPELTDAAYAVSEPGIAALATINSLHARTL